MGRTTELSNKITCCLLTFLVLSGFNGMGCLAHCAIVNNLTQKTSSALEQASQTVQIDQDNDLEDHSCCADKSEKMQLDGELEGACLLTIAQQNSCCCSKGINHELVIIPQNQKSVAHTIQPAIAALFIPAVISFYFPDKRPERLPDQSRTYLQCSVILI